jgi:enediyne biosynthesis protein E5
MHRNVDLRLGALRRFAVAITVFNLLGHTVLGFEQAWAHPLLALAVGYSTELLLELIDAWAHGRKLRFERRLGSLMEFLLPAHISALAVSMLLYPNQRLAPVAFATVAAIGSKYFFRVSFQGRSRHFFNPSNFGISLTLLTFHWVAIAPPYMFTENLRTVGDWLLPALIVCTGSFLNIRFTKRWPLIASWLIAFAIQAVVRSTFGNTPMLSALAPMTGLAFLLFTFYMVSDPSTTPTSKWGQVLFGAGVAATYGLLLTNHVVFTLFFALSIVCVVRGVSLYIAERLPRRAAIAAEPLPAPAALAPAVVLASKGLESVRTSAASGG